MARFEHNQLRVGPLGFSEPPETSCPTSTPSTKRFRLQSRLFRSFRVPFFTLLSFIRPLAPLLALFLKGLEKCSPRLDNVESGGGGQAGMPVAGCRLSASVNCFWVAAEGQSGVCVEAAKAQKTVEETNLTRDWLAHKPGISRQGGVFCPKRLKNRQ